ncbi:phosphoglycerate dehydrogenase [Lachnospiraceae bacterium OttesenSCG-928-E19]|nr:phosphoglycerate dehydrogenase [Lachnospiraceae bacterium OttesenSCG-928-E19]
MEKYKVVVTARSFGKADNQAEELLKSHNCQVIKVDPAEIGDAIGDADAVIAGLDVYNEELIAKAKQLKVISRYGVGYDKVDVKAATARGVKVTITPGANGDSVADLAVALMLDVARNVAVMDHAMKKENQVRPSGIELWQKTLGVVGAGRIGQGVARRCKGFDMNILCFDTYEDETFKKECNASYVDFEQLIAESDFITIHAPMTPETENMFNADVLRKMKNSAVIVNTARGGIIDEDALYEALKSGEIYGAALDATVKEPPYGSPLLTLDNCIITPHAGAATKEASSKMSLMAAQNVIEVLEQGDCKFAVKA